MRRQFYVYILTNNNNTVLYTGVTSDLSSRLYEHESGIGSVFTSAYKVKKLVYYEVHDNPESAISREKYIKGKKRKYKEGLVNKMNPNWAALKDC